MKTSGSRAVFPHHLQTEAPRPKGDRIDEEASHAHEHKSGPEGSQAVLPIDLVRAVLQGAIARPLRVSLQPVLHIVCRQRQRPCDCSGQAPRQEGAAGISEAAPCRRQHRFVNHDVNTKGGDVSKAVGHPTSKQGRPAAAADERSSTVEGPREKSVSPCEESIRSRTKTSNDSGGR